MASGSLTAFPIVLGTEPKGVRAVRLPDGKVEAAYLGSFANDKAFVASVREKAERDAIAAKAAEAVAKKDAQEKLVADAKAAVALRKQQDAVLAKRRADDKQAEIDRKDRFE